MANTQNSRLAAIVRWTCGAGLLGAAGVIAFMFGSGRLQLPVAKQHKPPEAEAYPDWTIAPDAEAAPESQEPRRLTAHFTDISEATDREESAVVPAVHFDSSATHDDRVAFAGFSPADSSRTPQRLPEETEAATASGAWLTGTIEETTESAGAAQDALPEINPIQADPTMTSPDQIPAWRRSSKSRKEALRAASKSAGRR